jgi:hypothetical protein
MKYLIILVFFLKPYFLDAQELITDRPDQTESSATVPKNSVQWETGSSYNISEGSSNYLAVSSNLFRIGIANKLELRLSNELGSYRVFNVDRYTGISDLEAGFKYNILDSDIEMAVIGSLSLPTGSAIFTKDKTGVIAILCLTHPLSEKIGLGYNFGLEYFDKKNYSTIYSMVFGVSFSDKLGIFTEIYGNSDGFDDFFFNYDNGFTYLVKPNFQIDLSFGTGLNYDSNFYSAGLSWRLPD